MVFKKNLVIDLFKFTHYFNYKVDCSVNLDNVKIKKMGKVA